MKTNHITISAIVLVGFLLAVILMVYPEGSDPERDVKEFNMTARNWEFEPQTIEVEEGDKVILNMRSEDIDHGIYIKGYDLSKRIEPGKTTKLEFIADKQGEFLFGCSVPCGMGHSSMTGSLIVK